MIALRHVKRGREAVTVSKVFGIQASPSTRAKVSVSSHALPGSRLLLSKDIRHLDPYFKANQSP